MPKFLSIAAAFIVSAAMAFAQGAATDQSPSSPPHRGASAAQGSAPNQALPGNANPADATTKEGKANRQAVNPNQKGANAAPEVGNPGDNSDNNGMAKDDTGNNPASGRGSNTITKPGTAGTVQWFWIALALIVGVVLIGILASRNRMGGNIEPEDPALRASETRGDFARRDPDQRDDERIRRAG